MANLATINNNLLADSGIDPLSVVIGSGTANQIAYWIDADNIGALTTATYPSLTELSYVKGVTSAIQTQLNNRLYKDTSQLTGTNLNNMTTSGLYYSADQYSTNTNIPYNNYFVLFNLMNDADRQAQLFFTDTPSTSGGLWWRPKQGIANWHSWEKIITTVNYNSYSPTLTGTGASGTWGISITGSSATTSAVSGTTNYIPKFTSASAIGNSNLINDNSGNLGLGVNPSAWSSSWRAFEFQAAAIAWTGAGANDFSFSTNSFFDSGDARWEYKGTGDGAARYSITALTSEHRWYNAPVGTAGNAISFTQAMTLKATSQLQLNQYGSGTFTGTRAYDLAIDASGNIIEVAVGAGTVTGTGTTNYIPKWTGTSAIGNSTIYDDGTNVGIGGVSVGSRLSVYSGAGLSGRVFEAYYGSGANQPFNIGINRNSGNAWIGWNAYQSTGDTQVYQLNNTASRITAGSGFVFQVAASGTANNAITWTDAASISTAGNLTTNSWAKFYNVAIGGTATGTYAAYSDSVVGFDNLHLVATGSGAVYINTAIARPTYINPAGGSVGINTTSPGVFTLNVNGTIKGISTFSTYVNDGLFSANARPTTIEMPNGSLLVLGYYSGGNGIYYGRIGWSTATEKVSFGAAATNTFRVGVGTGDTQMFTVNPSGIMSEGYIISNLGYVASTNGTVNNELSHGATFGIVGTTTNHALQIRTNGTTAITVSTSQGVSAVNNISAGTSINWNSGVGALSYGTGFVTLETNSATSIQFKTNGTTAQTIDTSQNVAFANNIGLSNTKAIYFATLADENWKIYRTAAPNFTRSLIGGFSLNINAHYSDEGFAIGANGGNSYYEIEGTGGGTSAEHYFRGIAGIGTLPNASYTLTVGGAFNASSATFSGALTVGTDGIFGNSRTANDAGATVVNILGSSSSSTSSQLNLTQVWNGVQYPIILRNIFNPTGGAASSIFTLSTTQWNGSIALTTERFRVDGDSGLSTFSGGVNITTSNSPGLNIVKNASTDNRYLRLTNTQASAKAWDLINQTNANGNKFVIYNATDNLAAVEVLTNGGVNFSNTLYLPSSIAGRTAQIEFANSSSANLLGMPNLTTTFYLTYGTNNLHFRNDNAGEMLRLINDGNIYVINNLGINTAPSYRLHVLNAANGHIARFTGGASSNINIGIYASNAAGFGSIGTQSNHGFNLYTNDTDRLIITNTGAATFTSTVAMAGGSSSAQFVFGDYGIGMSRGSTYNGIWFNSGTDTNHVLWNDYYGGPGVRGGAASGFDGIKWNVYRGIYLQGGSGGSSPLLTITNSSGATADHTVTLYASGTARLATNTSGVSVTGNLSASTTINWYSGIGALSYGTGFITMETNSANAIQFKTNGSTAQTINTNQTIAFGSDIGLNNGQGIYFNTLADANWRIYRSTAPNFTRSIIGSGQASLNLSIAASANEGFAIGANGGSSYYEIKVNSASSADHYFRGRAGIGDTPSSAVTLNTGTIRFTCGFSTYTPDGLFSGSAEPSWLDTPGASKRLRFGYYDYGGGQYYGAIGFDGPTQFSIGHRYSSNGNYFGFGTGYSGNAVVADNANTVFIPQKLSIGGWGANGAGLNIRGYNGSFGVILDRGTQLAWTNGSQGTTGEYIYSQADSPYSVTIHSGAYNAIACPNTSHVYINHEAGTCSIGSTSFSTSYKLYVTGSTYSSGGYFEASDTRLKDIVNEHKGINFGAIEFKWNDGRDNKLHWGYAAQQVLDWLPDAVTRQEDGYLSLDYNQVHTYKIAMLEKRIAELEQQLKNK